MNIWFCCPNLYFHDTHTCRELKLSSSSASWGLSHPGRQLHPKPIARLQMPETNACKVCPQMFASNVFFQSLFYQYSDIHISYKESLSHPGRQLHPIPLRVFKCFHQSLRQIFARRVLKCLQAMCFFEACFIFILILTFIAKKFLSPRSPISSQAHRTSSNVCKQCVCQK